MLIEKQSATNRERGQAAAALAAIAPGLGTACEALGIVNLPPAHDTSFEATVERIDYLEHLVRVLGGGDFETETGQAIEPQSEEEVLARVLEFLAKRTEAAL